MTLAETGEALERFRREAQSASALNHPNICTIHEIGEHEGRPFIAMELMKGKTLKHTINGKPMEIDQVLELGCTNCGCTRCSSCRKNHSSRHQAAQYFYDRTRPGKAARLRSGQTERRRSHADTEMPTASTPEHLTKSGSTMGTVAYMSPEQARGKDLDARTDLFSFGVVLYEMVTGTLPFGGQTTGEMLEAIFTKEPVAPVRLNPNVPAKLEEIIAKAMEKDRNLRYQQCSRNAHRFATVEARYISRFHVRAGRPALRRNGIKRRPRRAALRKGWDYGSRCYYSCSTISSNIVLLCRQTKTTDTKAAPPAAATSKTAIAVLPFTNLSADEDQEYFSDGLTEELLNVLAKNPKLQVTSRTSAFSFKGTKTDIKTIAEKLNVTHVLEGSVRKAGNQIADHGAVDRSGNRLASLVADLRPADGKHLCRSG